MAPKGKAAPAKAKAALAKAKAAPAKAKAAAPPPKAKAGVATKRKEPEPASSVAAPQPDLKKQKSEPQIEKKVMKGRAAVDTLFPDHKKYHVFQEADCVWDCMLNQSDVGNNNNKFYIIQLLESDTAKQFTVWTRWGRVGAAGQNARFDFGGNLASAKAQFGGKFQDKSKNFWANRANFKKVPGKYHLIERDYGVDDDEEMQQAMEAVVPESKLPKQVQDFVKLICDVDMMKKQMVEVGYDAKKMPLGKISKKMISDGFNVLKEISGELDKPRKNGKRLTQLSSDFFTVIPHNFGFQNMSNFIINTEGRLKEKLLMVEALADIEVAHRMLDAGTAAEANPVDKNYANLKCQLTPLDPTSEIWSDIVTYVKNTHGHTHTGYDIKVKQIFEAARDEETKRFEPFAKNPNRMLLWHGSRLTNWVGILSQGLRIAPPEAPVSGYMFGKGVYFADMVSKSANYCRVGFGDKRAVMLLCEVAVGKSNELKQCNYNANELPKGCLSTLGLGRTAPNASGMKTHPGGVKVPMGAGGDSGINDTSLQYNEFIVYDVVQIKMRYVMEMEFQNK